MREKLLRPVVELLARLLVATVKLSGGQAKMERLDALDDTVAMPSFPQGAEVDRQSAQYRQHVMDHLMDTALCMYSGDLDALAEHGLIYQDVDQQGIRWTFTVVPAHPDERTDT